MHSKAKIRAIALDLLNSNGLLKAPVDVKKVAKIIGAKVELMAFKDDLSGFSYRDDKEKIIGINQDHSKERQRFTIAHEIGHIKFHGGNFHYDKTFSVEFRGATASQGTDVKEITANRFAAELLMPKVLLEQDLTKYGELIDAESTSKVLSKLAGKYNVSEHAMTVRLASLGYLM